MTNNNNSKKKKKIWKPENEDENSTLQDELLPNDHNQMSVQFTNGSQSHLVNYGDGSFIVNPKDNWYQPISELKMDHHSSEIPDELSRSNTFKLTNLAYNHRFSFLGHLCLIILFMAFYACIVFAWLN